MIFGSLAVADASLMPDWHAPNRKAFLYVPHVEPAPPSHRPLLTLDTPEGGRPLVVESHSGERRLLFDPGACFRAMTHEEYYEFHGPRFRLPLDYHVVPSAVRHFGMGLYSRVAALVQGKRDGFPRWPVEDSLELLAALLVRLGLGDHAPARRPWPHGKQAAFCVTHDVDTTDAQSRVGRIREVEESLGVQAGWFFTAGAFPLDHGLLRSLREAGHEIGSHDSNHDMCTPFLPPDEIRRRLQASLEALEPYAVTGFRAPGLVRNSALYTEAARLFAYDSSCPDTDSLPGLRRPGGCMTVFPFHRQGMLVLPVTLPQDIIYLLRGFTHAQILDSLRAKIRWIREVGGLALLLTHPEADLGGSPAYLALHRRLLEEMTADPSFWRARPGDVARHCGDSFHCGDSIPDTIDPPFAGRTLRRPSEEEGP